SPPEVQGGQMAAVTLTISSAAPAGGLTAALSVDNTQAVTLPNPTITFPSGATVVVFQVSTSAVSVQTVANISAAITVGGQTAMGSAALKIDATTSAQVATIAVGPPTTVEGTQTVNGVVTLTQAPQSPAVVVLSSTPASLVTFGSTSVPIAAGQMAGAFTVTSTPVVTTTPVTLTATLNNAATTTLNLSPLQLMSLTISPGTVTGGQNATGTITLGGTAPTGGTAVALTSSGNNAIVPATVTVPSGQATASFTIRSNPTSTQSTATITATLNSSTKTNTLTINPPAVSGVQIAAVGLSPSNVSSG